jgi:hypothetical protein
VAPGLAVSTSSLAPGSYGASYAATQLQATGGVAPYTWSVAGGSTLPPGITLAGGVLSGEPGAAGTFSFAIAATDSASYTVKQNLSLTVNPAPLTITASNQSKTYGTALALGTTGFTISGLIGTDTTTGVTLTSSGAAAAAAAGSYDIVASAAQGTGLGNYQITYAKGTLTVGKATLTVTGLSASKPYDGTTAAALSFTGATLNGVATGDSGNVTLNQSGYTAGYAGKNVGSNIAVTVSGLSLGGSAAGNYTLTQPALTGTITLRPITVTAAASSKTYDGTTSSTGVPGITAGSLAGSDSAVWTQTYDNANAGSSHVMTPAGVVSDGNGGANYSVIFTTINTGVITAAPLTVTANNASMAYGAALLPSLTASYSGFVNGETQGVLGGTPSLTTTASITSAVGVYSIVAGQGTLSDNNYAFSFQNGTLTINPSTPQGSASYLGTQSPGDVWSWTITKDGSGNGTFAGTDNTSGNTYSGSLSTLRNNFLQLTITATTDSNVTVPTVAYAVEFPNTALIVKPAGANDAPIIAAAQGSCPSPANYNWIKMPNQTWDVNTDPAYGTAVTTAGGSGFDLSLSPSLLSGTALSSVPLTGLSCTDGVLNSTAPGTPTFDVTPSGAFISDQGTGGGVVGMLQPAADIGTTNILQQGREFRGFVFMTHPPFQVSGNSCGSPVDKTQAIWARSLGSGNPITAAEYTDVGNGVEDLCPGGDSCATLSLGSEVAPGLFTGTMNDSHLGQHNFTLAINQVNGKYVVFGFSQEQAGGQNCAYDGVYPYLLMAMETSAPSITATALPSGVIGSQYSAQLQAVGGTKPYTWNVVGSPGLPSGLSLNGNTITGAVQSSGSYPIGVEVVDSSTPPLSAYASLTITMVAPAAVNIVSGNNQAAPVTAEFSTALTVQVLDGNNNPLPGANVTFNTSCTTACSVLSAASVTTDSNGNAAITATANTIAGSYTVSATAPGLTPLVFNLTNLPGPAVSVVVSGGSSQSATVGAAFTNALAASVADAYGNPVIGASVTFGAPGTGAGVTFTTANPATSNSSGIASVNVTANTVAGVYNVTASVAGAANAATFSLTNLAGAAAAIQTVPGSTPQSANINTAFTNPLGVTVLDSYGNPVANATVNFSAPNSGASALLSSANPITNASGQASVTATANNTPGGYSVDAYVSGVANPAAFNLTNVPTFSISGFVQGYGQGLNGVTVNLYSFDGQQLQSVVTAPCSGGQGAPGNTGCYAFTNVPNGTYTITPPPANNITGADAVFSPPSLTGVTVSGGPLTNKNFQVSLGYTVTGTVGYPANDKTGVIYITLQPFGSSMCSSFSYGTAISSPGAFTIRGVCPGTFSLSAWMDSVGLGYRNGSNPTSTPSPVTIPSSSGLTATLADSSNSFSGMNGPVMQLFDPAPEGVTMQVKPVVNTSGVEMPPLYHIQWSADSSFQTGVNETRVFANNGQLPYLLSSNTLGMSLTSTSSTGTALSGLGNGDQLWFRIRGENGPVTKYTNWTTAPAAVTIGALSPGASPVTISGNVNYPGTATGPLYAGCYDETGNNVYAETFATPSSFPVSYSVSVPSGANCFMFGFIDNNQDGVIGPGDVSDTDQSGTLSISGAGPYSQDITLSNASSTATLTTENSESVDQYNNLQTSYGLNFGVKAGTKVPAAVELNSGPNVIAPMDAAVCSNCGKAGQFSFGPSLGSTSPQVGDQYTLDITYDDDSTGVLTPAVSVVLNAFATNLSPVGSVSAVGDTTPTFSWTDPSNAGSYIYQFSLTDWATGTQIWQIPSSNSNSSGFSSSTTQLAWPANFSTYTDPTGANNPPSVSSLTAGHVYQWAITVQDGSGNSARYQVTYTPQ